MDIDTFLAIVVKCAGLAKSPSASRASYPVGKMIYARLRQQSYRRAFHSRFYPDQPVRHRDRGRRSVAGRSDDLLHGLSRFRECPASRHRIFDYTLPFVPVGRTWPDQPVFRADHRPLGNRGAWQYRRCRHRADGWRAWRGILDVLHRLVCNDAEMRGSDIGPALPGSGCRRHRSRRADVFDEERPERPRLGQDGSDHGRGLCRLRAAWCIAADPGQPELRCRGRCVRFRAD